MNKFDLVPHSYDSDACSPDESREWSHLPGKFESEPPYTAYMWERLGLWGELPDDDTTMTEFYEVCAINGIDPNSIEAEGIETTQYYRWDVSGWDRLLFPELETIAYVILWESDQGFVYTDSVVGEFDIPPYIFVGI